MPNGVPFSMYLSVRVCSWEYCSAASLHAHFVGAVHLIPSLQTFGALAGPSVIASCMVAATAQLAATFAQAQHRTLLSVVLFPSLTYAIAFVTIVLLDMPMHLSVFLAYAIPAVIGLRVLARAGVLSTGAVNLSVTHQSKYFAMNNISAVCYNWLVNVYVSVLLGPEEVVLYTLVTRVAAMLSLPATASTPLIQARVAEKHGSGEARSVAKFSGMIVVLTSALQLLCVASLILIGCFTNYLNGVTQSGLAFGFLFYCFTQIFHVVSGPAGLILLMTGESRKVSTLTLMLDSLALSQGVFVPGIMAWLELYS